MRRSVTTRGHVNGLPKCCCQPLDGVAARKGKIQHRRSTHERSPTPITPRSGFPPHLTRSHAASSLTSLQTLRYCGSRSCPCHIARGTDTPMEIHRALFGVPGTKRNMWSCAISHLREPKRVTIRTHDSDKKGSIAQRERPGVAQVSQTVGDTVCALYGLDSGTQEPIGR